MPLDEPCGTLMYPKPFCFIVLSCVLYADAAVVSVTVGEGGAGWSGVERTWVLSFCTSFCVSFCVLLLKVALCTFVSCVRVCREGFACERVSGSGLLALLSHVSLPDFFLPCCAFMFSLFFFLVARLRFR